MTQVDGKIKKKRVKKLEKLNKKLNKRYIRKSKKQVLTVLVEEEQEGLYVGYTENYIKCYIAERVEPNNFVTVKLIKPYKEGALACVYYK